MKSRFSLFSRVLVLFFGFSWHASYPKNLTSALEKLKDKLTQLASKLAPQVPKFKPQKPTTLEDLKTQLGIPTDFDLITMELGGKIYPAVKKKHLFMYVMGMREKKLLEKIKTKVKGQDTLFHKIKDKGELAFPKKFKHGEFFCESVKDLRDHNKTKALPDTDGTLTILYGTNKKYLDTATLQAMPENKDAVFQLASNYHALETRANPTLGQKGELDSRDGRAPDGGVEHMAYARVQGEAGAVSAMPGTIHKMYYHAPINMLEYYNGDNSIVKKDGNQIKIFIPVNNNGKVDYAGTGHKKFIKPKGKKGYPLKTSANPKESETPTLDEKLLEDDTFVRNFIDNYKVAFTGGVQVTGGYFDSNQGNVLVTDEDHVINHIYSVGLHLGRNRTEEFNYNPKNKNMKRLAQLLLYATYEGVIEAAIKLEKEKLYLTLVGGGAFNNDPQWICDAIMRIMPRIKESGIKTYLVIFDSKNASDKKVYEFFQKESKKAEHERIIICEDCSKKKIIQASTELGT